MCHGCHWYLAVVFFFIIPHYNKGPGKLEVKS